MVGLVSVGVLMAMLLVHIIASAPIAVVIRLIGVSHVVAATRRRSR
jgi:hypothetical protein